MFTFDGANKLIIVDLGVDTFSASEIYSAWKLWMTEGDNAKYVPAFSNSVGGNPLGGGVSLGSYYFLENGWKIRPQEADHVLTLSGNLFPNPDTAGLFTPTLGNYNVQILMRVSSLTQQVLTSAVDSAGVAEAVWGANLSGAATADSAADIIKKTKSNAAAAVALSA